jgi:hypothetical protein
MKDSQIVILFLLAIIYFSYKRIQKIMDFESVIKSLKDQGYSYEYLSKIEQLYRNETAHFTSRQFNQTFSAGMEGFASEFPYGWITINREVWTKNPSIKPIGLVEFRDNHTNIMRPFLKFPDLYAAVKTLVGFVDYYGNIYRWNTTDEAKQQVYKSRLDSIKPRIVNKIFGV